jgi:hypothetical protein
MRRIYINESQLRLLTENRESKNLNKARQYIISKGYSQEIAQRTLDAIRTIIPNSRIDQYKFVLGICRMYLDNELNGQKSISQINLALKYAAKYDTEYDQNLNGEHADDIIKRFAPDMAADLENSKKSLAGKTYSNRSDYRIVRIPTYEDATKYAKYTDWCVTYRPDMYASYTHDGLGLFYFMLKNGFEKIPEEETEGCPKDEYGMSMIAVSVNEDGSLNTSTCRWNHDNGGADDLFSVEELSELAGNNFYNVFKPYSKKEIERKKEEIMCPFREAEQRLRNGENPEDIFDYTSNFNDGFARVLLNGKSNYINTHGELLFPNQWLDYISNFNEGFARVGLNNKWNFINTHGEILSPNQWFDNTGGFHDGFARVLLNDKWNFINTNGELLSPNQWFDNAGIFNDGFARVLLNDKWNFINTNGELLSPNQWFDNVGGFHKGFARVLLNGKWNYININRNLYDNNRKFIKALK